MSFSQKNGVPTPLLWMGWGLVQMSMIVSGFVVKILSYLQAAWYIDVPPEHLDTYENSIQKFTQHPIRLKWDLRANLSVKPSSGYYFGPNCMKLDEFIELFR